MNIFCYLDFFEANLAKQGFDGDLVNIELKYSMLSILEFCA